MATVFVLIRHGATDMVGNTVCGWTPGVHLNPEGRRQAEMLRTRLRGVPISAIYSSPLDRALETAGPLAADLGLPVEVRDALGELRYGDWTGHSFEDLNRDPAWASFNRFRSGTRMPRGEMMVESQVRIVAELDRLRRVHPGRTVAIFSHGDILRSAIGHYAGIHLDLVLRLEISPASVSAVSIDDSGPRILRLNDTGEWPHAGNPCW